MLILHKKQEVRYFLEIAYNGTPYAGWQIQPNATTVQGVLEEKLSLLLRQKTAITGAGRTDAGVHAQQMFAHFDVADAALMDNLPYKLNSILPPDIAVRRVLPVIPQAHARFDALSRSYVYIISKNKNPFKQNLYYPYYLPLNIERMNQAAALLLQYEDFTSFSKLHTDTHTNNCNISEAFWRISDEGELRFTITANRFLRNMVRAIVGTLLWVGKEKITVDEFKTIIQAENRNLAGPTAPAEGLFLQKITYPESIFINE